MDLNVTHSDQIKIMNAQGKNIWDIDIETDEVPNLSFEKVSNVKVQYLEDSESVNKSVVRTEMEANTMLISKEPWYSESVDMLPYGAVSDQVLMSRVLQTNCIVQVTQVSSSNCVWLCPKPWKPRYFRKG